MREMQRRKVQYGVASLCIGGGQAMAMKFGTVRIIVWRNRMTVKKLYVVGSGAMGSGIAPDGGNTWYSGYHE